MLPILDKNFSPKEL